jgi:flagellar hook-length control protein FliK
MSAPSLAIPAAPALGHAVAPKRGAGTPDADFAAILDETASPEAPAKAPAPTAAKGETETVPAPIEDAVSDAVVDTAPVTDQVIAAGPVPLTVVAPTVVVEFATTEAVAAAPAAEVETPPAPSDDIATPTDQPDVTAGSAPVVEDTAPVPAYTVDGKSPATTGTAPVVDADVPVAAPTAADLPDLTALQAAQAKAAAPAPAPVAAPVTAPTPRPAKPAADASTSAAAAPVEEAPVAAPAAPIETAAAPAAPVETPRTRDLIDRAQAGRTEARGASADSDASPSSDGPESAPTAAPASTHTAPVRPGPAAAPATAPVLASADEVAPAPLGATAQPSEARPAEAAVTPALSTLSRATIETTAQIAAQIVRKLEGRSTRFEMALTPEGLGNVDVSLDIDADGKLAARMAFDNPLAATELRNRVDELRRQLQDAGFTVADDALSFAERDASAGQGGSAFDRQHDPRNARAFNAASRLQADADRMATPAAWIPLTLTPDRVDMKV